MCTNSAISVSQGAEPAHVSEGNRPTLGTPSREPVCNKCRGQGGGRTGCSSKAGAFRFGESTLPGTRRRRNRSSHRHAPAPRPGAPTFRLRLRRGGLCAPCRRPRSRCPCICDEFHNRIRARACKQKESHLKRRSFSRPNRIFPDTRASLRLQNMLDPRGRCAPTMDMPQ